MVSSVVPQPYGRRLVLEFSNTVCIVDHFQYKELAGAIYRHIGGHECYDRIERGFAAMEQMISDGRNEDLADMLHLCDEIDGALDIQLFFLILSDFYSSFTQFEQYVQLWATSIWDCKFFKHSHFTVVLYRPISYYI